MTREEFDSEYANITNKIHSLEEELMALKKEYAKSLTNIRPGDTIVCKDGTFFVRKVELWCCNDVLIKASKIKKDGEPYKSESYIYPFHNPVKIKSDETNK